MKILIHQDAPHERSVYTVKQLAELWNVSPKSIYRLIKRGILKPVIVLRKYLITHAEATRVLEQTTMA